MVIVLLDLCTLLGGLFLSVMGIIALVGICSIGWNVVTRRIRYFNEYMKRKDGK
jgi:hypothetical protein